MAEVGGAVDGVDDPEPVRAVVEDGAERGGGGFHARGHGLLAEEAVGGEGGDDRGLDDALHLGVNLGEEVASVRLGLDDVRAELLEHDGRAELRRVRGDTKARLAHRGEVGLVLGNGRARAHGLGVRAQRASAFGR